MARVTHVKKAQQRYEMVPVLDEATGVQKTVPVMGKGGVQKTSKSRRPVFMKLTIADKTKPLPPLRCDAPNCTERDILVGTPYKHMSPKSGPYGGRKLTRHETCPTWHSWEYSSSTSARLEEVSFNFEEAISEAADPEEVTSALSEAAEAIREIAGEKEEGADNMESGFGHSTFMSDELRDTADQLNGWADDVENAEVPDLPEPDEVDCEECEGKGYREVAPDVSLDCTECDGSGKVTPDEPTDEQMDEWRSEVEEATSVVNESPV